MFSFIRKPWFLAIATGVLLWAAWSPNGFAPLLFIALIPLLFIEEKITKAKRNGATVSLFKWSYLSLFVFNLLTTWWIYFASDWGMAMAIILNTLFMATVFQLFHITRLRLGDKIGYLSLILYWTAFEYLHLNWSLSWTWLTFGNGLAAFYGWIQWYEFTGVLGGSLWILLSNVFLFSIIKAPQHYNYKKLFAWLMLIILPVCLSKIIESQYNVNNQKQKSVVVVQPNIDPYNEKFSGMSSRDQLNKMLQLASTVVDSATDYVVCPETALPDGIWENELQTHPQIVTIRAFMQGYPKLNFITGLVSNRLYTSTEEHPATARKFTDEDAYYDSYNTGMQLDSSKRIQLHHKSKLVIGVETLPFPFLEKIAINLGGASGSLGTQPSPSVFFSADSTGVAPVICYESIYGEYVTEYVKKGAQAIFIITNDGWWRDTPGYHQHSEYARLRAIETRRDIARSANTGISCFINQLGAIAQPTKWWTDDVIQQNIHLNTKLTFYVKYGDYLGVIAAVGSMLLLLGFAGNKLKERKSGRNNS